MKKIWAFIGIIVSFSSVRAQQVEMRDIGSFSGVKAAQSIIVYLKKGDREAVKVEVTGTDPSNIVTEISGSYLKIHRKDGRYRNVDAKVYVTYVNLDKLSASSAGNIFSEGTIEANSMEISASSAGSVKVSITAHSAEVSASSAGDVELKGKVERILAQASSAGKIDAYDLKADRVEAEASSAGALKVSVIKSLDAQASSGGNIRYRGNPDRSITNSTSGGSVKKSD